jgi:hypothetical protein
MFREGMTQEALPWQARGGLTEIRASNQLDRQARGGLTEIRASNQLDRPSQATPF